MINFKRFCLKNGLRLLVHEDKSTPLVAMNILYDVGSKNEDPSMTGLAHLAEHLMFCGSPNIPEYDLPLQLAGGDNNAFTNDDITNYYLTLPAENIETGFWLESDRMLGPDLNQKKFDIQKNVVIEEFKQRYLNQPYGDVMLLLRPLAYKIHPYRWPTIGMDISHLERIDLDNMRTFFSSFYTPENAIVTLSGNISSDKAFNLAEKWFIPVRGREIKKENLPSEPEQVEERRLNVERDVPVDALYKAWHMCSRKDDDYFTLDLLTDILAGGESGRLYNKLVREKKLFSEINTYITSDIEPGLLVMSGKLLGLNKLHEAEKAVDKVINELKDSSISDKELEKVKNRFESSTVLSNTGILTKSMNLSMNELLGDANNINNEVEMYRSVDNRMARDAAIKYLSSENCSTLYYMSSTKK